jgi:tetratricopeptide (TPR) repeat protein
VTLLSSATIVLMLLAPQPAPPRAAGHARGTASGTPAAADRATSVRALVERARQQSAQNDRAGALASLRTARRQAPSSEEVLSAFAEAALAANAPLDAVDAASVLVRLCPTVAGYHQLLGVALARAGDAAAAVGSLEEANRLEPDRPATLLALGQALTARNQYVEATKVLTRVLSLAADNLEAVSALAEAQAGGGELQAAEAHAREALARAPADATANLALGIVRMQQEKYEEARSALTAALAAAPSSAKARYQLSLACARLHDDVAARQHLARYRREAESSEARLQQVRQLTGFSSGGMQR